MLKSRKNIILTALLILLVLLVSLWILNSWIENKIVHNLKEEYGEAVTFEELDFNLLSGGGSVNKVALELDNSSLGAEELEVSGFSYSEYFSSGKIEFDQLEIIGPDLLFYTAKPDISETSEKFERDIFFNSVKIREGKIALAETDSSANHFFVAIANSELRKVVINENTTAKNIPFLFESYQVQSDSLFIELDTEHYLTLSDLNVDNGKLLGRNLKVIPKYPKVEFQKQIPHEKDRYDLHVEKISMDSLNWEFRNDSLYLRNNLLSLQKATLEVYRNKLLPDDESKKTLYSEKIRNLPFKIDFEKLELEKSHLEYQEKTRKDFGPGVVDFTGLNATVYNITNIGMGKKGFPRTEMDAQARLFGESLLEFHLEFDVSDPAEGFSFSGNVGSVSAKGINSYLRPALKIEIEGGIESLSFSFTGNDAMATGDMRLRYKDFKLIVLQEEGEEKNKLFSAVANLFTNNRAMDEEALHEGLVIQRDIQRSFWNLVWSCIQKGTLDSLI